MSAGEYIALTVSFGFVVLVGFTAYLFVKLAGVFQSTTDMLVGVTEKTVPLLGEVTTTVVHVNMELERVDAITENVQTVTTNVAGLSSLFAASLGSPLVKVAAFSYGVRRAAGRKRREEFEDRVKAEMKAEKKGRKK